MAQNDDQRQETSSEVSRLVERCLEALEEHTARTQAEERAGGLSYAPVEALLAEHPEHAAAVRVRLELLARTGLLAERGAGHEPQDEEFPASLGDFELRRPLGRGGMGVVYLAYQRSLEREVALKLISPGNLFFPGARDRFRREVEAVARLDHPGIVSIYVVGEDRGVPYFAMELVGGCSVDQMLERLPSRRAESLAGKDMRAAIAAAACSASSASSATNTFDSSWVDACFRVGAQAAEALVHAHERGVLHRDVKPSNVMLTPDGRARVLDFGLAWSEGASPLTRSGSQLGSLPYMAPEQVRGDGQAIDARTDVYALGVTLYQMLALRAPFDAETIEATRQNILAGQARPLDEWNAAVPWDAATVCMTAMDPDPRRRYPSMQAFGEDMRRFLSRQPIQAQRPGLWLRARRFCQRSPRRAALVLIAAALLVGGPLVYGVLERAARADLRVAYERQGLERERAEESLRDAIAAIDEILSQGSDAEFAASPGTDPARRQLLLRALELYERLAQREESHPALTTRVIQAQTRVARLQWELGELDAAIAASRRALELCDLLQGQLAEPSEARAAPTSAELEPAVAERELAGLRSDARFALLTSLFANGQTQEFRELCARELLEPLSPDAGVALRQSCNRVVVMQLEARMLQREGQVSEALAVLDRAVESCEGLLGPHPHDEYLLSELAITLATRAYFGGFHSKAPDYASDFERAAQLLAHARELNPDSPAHKNRDARVASDWAHVEIKLGKSADALPRAARADAILSQLCREFPLREGYAGGYLANAQRWSWALRLTGDTLGAEEVLQTAIVFGRAARERLPDSDSIAFYLAMLQSELAHRLGVRQEFERADALWDAAREAWEQLVARPEPQLSARTQVGTFYDNLARYQDSRGQTVQAEQSALCAVQWHERLLKLTGSEEHTRRLGQTLPLLVSLQIGLEHFEEAVQSLGRGFEAGTFDHSALCAPGFEASLGAREDYQALLERSRSAAD